MLLQDSDAAEEKVGKTSLLNAVFQEMTSFSDDFPGELCEYRWGEQELLTPVSDGMQKKFVTAENMKGISIVDTKGINRIAAERKSRVKEQIARSSAVFVVFSADSIRSPRLWDMLEGCPQKRMLFFLTMRKTIVQLKDSFALRKKQYESDYEILQKINRSLDDYMVNRKKFMDNFIKKAAAEINKDIDSYEREIISKLNSSI